MAYEKKVLDVLDKLVDSMIYEEGRLALINKYGPMLSDEEKVKATELITKQRASLDRLFQIHKNELEPIMAEISETSVLMEPLVEKLLFAGKGAVSNVEVATKEEVAPVQTEATTEVVETPAPVQADATTEVVETPAPVQADATTEVVETPVPTPAPVAEVAPVVNNDTALPATDLVIPAAGESEVHEATADAVENAASGEVATNSVESAAGALSGFVLSPIDEDVAPVPTQEEVKAAEEGVAAADQQLQAVDLMKTEIEANPNLTEEEKKDELQKYTKITEGAVRAILVTKAQYEKLLASRVAQKALLGGEEKKEEAVIPAIATEGAVDAPVAEAVAAENTAGDGAVIPAIVTDNTSEAAPVAVEGESVVAIPTITEGENVNPPGATGEAILPTIEIPGATPPAEGANNELQNMIEQGNALYKEGKTEEAEAVFNQVAEINQGIQSTIPEVADDAKVLVKE